MNTKKMCIITASPRKNGKIQCMAKAAQEQGKKSGYDISIINVYEKNIKNCTGCMACRKTGECVIKDDDMTDITQKIKESNLVVIAAPTYFANVPAPLKGLFDRIAGALMSENSLGMPHGRLKKEHKYILITSCTTPFPFNYLCNQSRGCIRAMNEVMHVSGMTMAGK